MPTLPRSGWTRGQDAKLRAMRSRGDSFEVIADAVGHSASACQQRASNLGVLKSTTLRLPTSWTDEQLATLRRMREARFGFEAIGIVIGRSATACGAKASELGIYKPKKEKPAVPTRSAQRVARERAAQEHSLQKVRSPARENFLQSVRAPASENKSRAQMRPCLNCTKTFKSEGPHHRLCSSCRGNTLHRYDTPVMVLR